MGRERDGAANRAVAVHQGNRRPRTGRELPEHFGRFDGAVALFILLCATARLPYLYLTTTLFRANSIRWQEVLLYVRIP